MVLAGDVVPPLPFSQLRNCVHMPHPFFHSSTESYLGRIPNMALADGTATNAHLQVSALDSALFLQVKLSAFPI